MCRFLGAHMQGEPYSVSAVCLGIRLAFLASMSDCEIVFIEIKNLAMHKMLGIRAWCKVHVHVLYLNN